MEQTLLCSNLKTAWQGQYNDGQETMTNPIGVL